MRHRWKRNREERLTTTPVRKMIQWKKRLRRLQQQKKTQNRLSVKGPEIKNPKQLLLFTLL
ncbi:ORF63 [White spot syndrome virus]|uniref:ORF63 n=1 Tax=White spot syndrome virus TaxID=342409 RepID=A0A2D3I726_9VIRU|nr:ORF63 [White spot syndrome virus]